MGQREIGIIETLGANVGRLAGAAARAKVMAGADRLTAKSGPAEIALWLRGAMDRLDRHVAKAKRVAIREACGVACAGKNAATLARAAAKRKRFKDLDSFLAAEARKPLTGTRLVREGQTLTWFFTPRTFKPPRRCFCGCMGGLPKDAPISETYCLCSRGFAKAYWERVLGAPVKVELRASCLRGDPECAFAITF
jgi:hypothetical protein